MEYKDKVVLVTGSSSGIGAGIASEYAKCGAQLFITGRNIPRLSEVKQVCEENGATKVTSVVADLLKNEDVTRLSEEVTSKHDHVDVLVLNAASTAVCSFENHTMDDFDRIFNTNIRAHFMLTKLLINHVKACKGVIVVISSNVATSKVPGVIAYGMSKAALDYFTECMASEYAKHGVRVVGISPGLVRTNNMAADSKLSRDQIEQVIKGGSLLQPLGGAMVPEDISKTVLFLTSKNASCITGHTVAIENGYSPFHIFPSL